MKHYITSLGAGDGLTGVVEAMSATEAEPVGGADLIIDQMTGGAGLMGGQMTDVRILSRTRSTRPPGVIISTLERVPPGMQASAFNYLI